jgi:hypothetical protein
MLKINKRNNMLLRNTIFTAFIIILFSCKTKDSMCDSYSVIQFIERDTICIESQHVHIEEEHICSYFNDIETIIVDTFEIKIPKQR